MGEACRRLRGASISRWRHVTPVLRNYAQGEEGECEGHDVMVRVTAFGEEGGRRSGIPLRTHIP